MDRGQAQAMEVHAHHTPAQRQLWLSPASYDGNMDEAEGKGQRGGAQREVVGAGDGEDRMPGLADSGM